MTTPMGTTPSSGTTPSDQHDRDSIATDLDKTLFVGAGAGTGKTTALVGRVQSLLDSGVAMENIAAITFTEKAAAELKNRLREKLTGHPDALDQLDGAAITTLHGFALRILSQHAVEAGLPPRLEVSPLDSFEDRWEEFRDRLLYTPDHQQTMGLALTIDISTRHLRALAQNLDANWDLVQERVGADTPPSEPVEVVGLDGLIAKLNKVCSLADHCLNPDDKLIPKLAEIGQWARDLSDTSGQDVETTRILLGTRPSFKVGKIGSKNNWPGEDTLKKVRNQVRAVGEEVERFNSGIAHDVITRLTLVLGRFVLKAAEDRKRSGVLEYHDLLVLARNLLRDPDHGPQVRRALAERYQHLLLDEFQDTDPIQIDIAKLITTDPGDNRAWPELADKPGRLFYVGDAKQSIYRFRRADIAVYAKAAASPTVNRKSLTRNFRSAEPILAWVNALFEKLMTRPPDEAETVQPSYQPLDPVRGHPPVGPPVAVLDTEHDTKVGEVRAAEAEEVAQAILTAVGQGWSVGNGRGNTEDEPWRPCRLADICILLPTRTALPQLEPALQRHRIPYRIEAGSLIWADRSIRDVMAVVRSLADPTDQVALLTALRSPAFGCGDDDLFTFKVTHRGRWNYLAPVPKSLPADHPVGEAMAWLADLHPQVRWLNPSLLIEKVVSERRLLETGCFGSRRPRDVWRNLLLVIDQAREFEESGGRGLREFIAWAERKVNTRTMEVGATLTESDDDAVRITTIHASKGREFPIVILAGTYDAGTNPNTPTVLWPTDGGWDVRLRKGLETATFETHELHENQMTQAEKERLLYVALTRAMDHVVVSAHRQAEKPQETKKEPSSDEEPPKLSMAQMVVRNAAELPQAEWEPTPLVVDPVTDRGRPTMSRSEWRRHRAEALVASGRPTAVGASSVAGDTGTGVDGTGVYHDADHPGLAKEGDTSGDDLVPQWGKGRYGTKVGSAVHGVLQAVDLAQDPVSLDTNLKFEDIANAHADAEGVRFRRRDVKLLAKSILGSATVREAAGAKHWKEMFVATSIGGTVLEGYIDLLYRSDDGNDLVVVDYKTDDTHDDSALEAKIDRYKLQVAAYALAVEHAVGEAVTRGVLVFALSGKTATEVILEGEDLAWAQEEVHRRLTIVGDKQLASDGA